MSNEADRRDDVSPRYVAPQALAAVPLREERPSPDPGAVREGDRAAVPDRDWPLVAENQRVVLSDGHELGHVKEIGETHFKVDVPMRSDFWLLRDDVAESDSEVVIMRFPREELDGHAMDRPGPVDSLLSDEEQLEQRQQMEAELDAQRGRSPDDDTPVIGRNN
jgi:hypothetical protein